MKNTVLKFGLYSGVVSATLMFLTTFFVESIGFDRGVYVGYTAILISFLFVYFGVRSYRDNVLGGQITFARGFNAGILITLISCACYVATWEFVYFNLMPDFAEKYTAYAIEHARASGATQQAIDATARQMEDFKRMYDNPLMNAAITFTEPFPIGLLVTLISAAVLRTKK